MIRRHSWIPIYILTAGLGLAAAFVVSSNWMEKAFSQAPPPSDGSLPPEFLNEIEGGTPPASAPPSQAPTPPPPLEDLSAPAGNSSGVPTPQPPPPTQPNSFQPPVSGGENYVYDPTGRRDPFQPYRAIRSQLGGKIPVLEPLQSYDLEQISVVGILWDVRSPRALVKDSDGKLHTIVKNTKLGRNNGFVAMIREGEIIVIETFEEDGKSFKRSKVLEFKR